MAMLDKPIPVGWQELIHFSRYSAQLKTHFSISDILGKDLHHLDLAVALQPSLARFRLTVSDQNSLFPKARGL